MLVSESLLNLYVDNLECTVHHPHLKHISALAMYANGLFTVGPLHILNITRSESKPMKHEMYTPIYM